MNKEYFFLAGLPRSGQTLLSSILNQNPDLHVGPESPVCNLISVVFNSLENNEQHNLYPKPEIYPNLARSIMDGYYYDVDKKYIMDKCRVWNSSFNMDLIKLTLNPNAKIVCGVRDILEVLTSYITLIHNSPDDNFVDQNLTMMNLEVNDENRCMWLMREHGLVGLSCFALQQTHDSENVHLIEYNDLVNDTDNVISNLYDFLEIPHYNHTYDNITNNFKVSDDLLGVPTLHHVRSTISKTSLSPEEVLPESILKEYKDVEFWR